MMVLPNRLHGQWASTVGAEDGFALQLLRDREGVLELCRDGLHHDALSVRASGPVVAALGVGLLLAVLGGPSGSAADAEPATVRLAIGARLSLIDVGLLLSALVIVGLGWYLKHPQAE